MKQHEKRFEELIKKGESIPVRTINYSAYVDSEKTQEWLASSINLLELVYGKHSTLTQRLCALGSNIVFESNLKAALGTLKAAFEEYKLGYLKGVRREITDELIVDLCLHADQLLAEGYSAPAAVLVAAAVEDCFKRKAEENGIATEDLTLSNYIGSLKSKGVLSGATSKIVSGFPKFRNNAMHADWGKITDAEISSISSFVKQFVLN